MRNCFNKILLSAVLLTASMDIHAQYTVRGTVVDDRHDPLPGAAVSVEGLPGVGTTTNEKGNFQLCLPDNQGHVLKFKYLGFLAEIRHVRKADSMREVRVRMQQDAIGVENVVVTGTRTPKFLKDAPIITRVIGEKDIKNMDATNIADMLQTELPGMEFSFKMNQQVSLNVNGFGGNSLLFLVDGERLAGETMDNVDYARLNLDNVARIEIVKGAASSLYGSNAVGGVVNIITKEAEKPWTANVNAHYSQPGFQRYGASLGLKGSNISSSTVMQLTKNKTINLHNEGRKGNFNEIYGNRTASFKEQLVYQPMSDLKITGRAGYFFRQRDVEGPVKDRYRDFSAGLRANYKIGQRQHVEIGYSFDQYDKSLFNEEYKTDVRNYSNVQHILRGMYNFSWTENYSFVVGGDLMRDYLLSYQFNENGSHKQYTTDLFAQADMNFAKDFNVVAGLRYDAFSEADLKHVSATVATLYKRNHCSLRASYAGGFRAPTLKEMYMNFNMANIFMIYGNKNLKPENSHNFQVSAEYLKGRANVSVTGFYNIVQNRITTLWSQWLSGQQYVNTQRVDISGIEADAAVKYPSGISARISYCYTHESVRRNELQGSGTRPHSATGQVGYERRWKNVGMHFFLNGRVLSGVWSDQMGTTVNTIEKVKSPGYALWKLIATLNLPKGMNVTCAVDNLLNYKPKYYYNNSPITTGTTFSTTLSVDIDRLFAK